MAVQDLEWMFRGWTGTKCRSGGKKRAGCPRCLEDTGGPPVPPFGRSGKTFARAFRNAFAALAVIFKNREADLAWPKRSKGKKVPA